MSALDTTLLAWMLLGLGIAIESGVIMLVFKVTDPDKYVKKCRIVLSLLGLGSAVFVTAASTYVLPDIGLSQAMVSGVIGGAAILGITARISRRARGSFNY